MGLLARMQTFSFLLLVIKDRITALRLFTVVCLSIAREGEDGNGSQRETTWPNLSWKESPNTDTLWFAFRAKIHLMSSSIVCRNSFCINYSTKWWFSHDVDFTVRCHNCFCFVCLFVCLLLLLFFFFRNKNLADNLNFYLLPQWVRRGPKEQNLHPCRQRSCLYGDSGDST